MVGLQPLVSEFNLAGRLDDFVLSSKGCLKYLYLSTIEADYRIKVLKSPRTSMASQLQANCYLKVTGMQKNKLHKGEVEYTAYTIELLPEPIALEKAIARESAQFTTVLICSGSSCQQQGGKAICQLLQAKLHDGDLTNKVKIKTTGCLKQCKQAPNIAIAPGRNRYGRVQPQQALNLLNKHLQENT